jgi:hypothetical protein
MFLFLSFALALSKQRVFHSQQVLNKYVHFNLDLLWNPDEVHARRRLELSSPVPLGGSYVTKALLYELATLCFFLHCQAGRGVAGFCN